ncbi:Tyrosine-protein kinase Yes, partial [Varanus komodoensis]
KDNISSVPVILHFPCSPCFLKDNRQWLLVKELAEELYEETMGCIKSKEDKSPAMNYRTENTPEPITSHVSHYGSDSTQANQSPAIKGSSVNFNSHSMTPFGGPSGMTPFGGASSSFSSVPCPYPSGLTDSLPELTEIVSDLVLKTPRMLVLGDFNLHAEMVLTGAAQDFIASMAAMGLSQRFSGPTHECGHTLDLVFLTGQEEGDLRVRNLSLTPLSWSDHFLIRFELENGLSLCKECRPAELLRVVQGLIHPGPKKDLVPPSKACCDDFARHFREKIAQICHELDSTVEPDSTEEMPMTPSSPQLMDEFQLLQPDDVDKVLGQVRPTTCLLDPCPSWLLKKAKDGIGTWILEVVNASLRDGRVPSSLKEAVVRPVLKKAPLDPEVAANYRPVTNIPFLGKVLEQVVAGQLQAFLDETHYLDPFQSGFRPGYGTESALVTLYDDLCRKRDGECVPVSSLGPLSSFRYY